MSTSNDIQENEQQVVHPHESKMGFMQKVRLVFLTLLAIFLVTFIVQNLNRVELEFLNLNFRVRIIYIILFSAIVGALIALLMTKTRAARKKRK